jgi:peptidoglycan/LPS O-acetylase OafA/YrhL
MVLSLALRAGTLMMGGSPWVADIELPTRMDSFLIGGLLALGLRGPQAELWSNAKLVRSVLLASFAGVVLVCVLDRSFYWAPARMNTIGFTLIASSYCCILALALIPGTLTGLIGTNNILRIFGRYSYGLYLFHYLFEPVCVRFEPAFLHKIHPAVLGEMVYVVVVLAVFTGMAGLSYELFEKRFLQLKQGFVPDSQVAHGQPEWKASGVQRGIAFATGTPGFPGPQGQDHPSTSLNPRSENPDLGDPFDELDQKQA